MAEELTPAQADRLLKIKEKYGSGTTRESTQAPGILGEIEGTTDTIIDRSSRESDGAPDTVSQRRNGQVQGSLRNDGTHGSVHLENGQSPVQNDASSSGLSQSDSNTADRNPQESARINEPHQIDTSADKSNPKVEFQPIKRGRGRPPGIKKATDQIKESVGRIGQDLKETVKLTPETSKKLSQKEIDEIGDDFREALQLYFSLIDDGMAAVTMGHTNPHIWEMDESEAAILSDMWLDMGKQSVKAAHTVRVMVNLKKKFAAGVILVSRVFASMDYVMTQGIDIPRPRKRKGTVHAVPFMG